MKGPNVLGSALGALFAIIGVLVPERPAKAHPHVFMDGGVDFVFDDQGALASLGVTWHYDLFETLYVLSSLGILPAPDGTLTAENKARVIAHETTWPDDFKGAAHLEIEGKSLPLSNPKFVEVKLEDDRLVLRFTRHLEEPAAVAGRLAEVAFYEATYYYAFAVTDPPRLHGAHEGCVAGVKPFDPDAQTAALQVMLSALGREETPEDANVGALFADRIFLDCR